MKRTLIIIILSAVLLSIIGFSLRNWLFKNPKYRFGTDRAAVITQVQALANLETASFSIEKVIEAGTDYSGIKQVLLGDKILLIAHGKVVAGIDLQSLKPEEFKGSGDSITVQLPPPRILSATLDNSKTTVYDRTQGYLTRGDVNLEALARQQAESAIRQAACEGGIMREANSSAQQQLTTLFKAAGFKQVTILTREGAC